MSGRWQRPYVLSKPEQGWSSLLLLLALLVLLGISIANARAASLVLRPDASSVAASLPVLMLTAGLVGFLLARSHIGVVRAHIIGATVAAALLLFIAGENLLQAGVIAPEGAVSARVGAVWVQLEAGAVSRYLERELTAPAVVTYLVFGALCWTTAQFSAFSVFRYDRGGPAVIAVGMVLFLNVGLDSFVREADLLPVLPVLALFAALAMLLLMRMQLATQRLQWARRHISDTGEVSRLFLRSGVIFVTMTVVSATSLTAVATVEAQRLDLGDLETPLKDLGDDIADVLGIVGVPPVDQLPQARGEYSPIDEQWTFSEGTAFTARIERGELRGNYWWGFARDEYTLDRGWTSSERHSRDIAAGEAISVPLAATARGRHEVDAVLTMGDAATLSLTAYSPAEAVRLPGRSVKVISDDEGRGISVIEFEDAVETGDDVRVIAEVRDYGPESELTADELRRADGPYPEWIDQYLAVPDGAVGPAVDKFADAIRATQETVYDQALAVQNRLREMEYETDMRGICDGYEGSVPECVIAQKTGFCQYYATTMAIVLRELGIPSRFITGYLPGQPEPRTGVLTVPGSSLHNWVEAYFPGIGWVRFDPTPGRGPEYQTATDFPEGPVTPPSPEPTDESLGEGPTFEPTPVPTADDEGTFVAEASRTEPPTSVVIVGGAIVVLLLAVMSALLLFRLRRLPAGDEGLAYRGIVSLATRLGYGPHPSQTEYEYADALSEAVPSVRDELFVVAGARVETSYGRRRLDAARRDLLRRAYARIRTALLKLSLRGKR